MSEGPGQRPAPQVTVTDPNRPAGGPADVLGSGTDRDPWRPKAWQLKAVALAVLLTAAGVLPGRVVTARAQDHRAAVVAAEAARLSVVAGVPRETAPSRFRLVLSNDSPVALRVLDVQLDGPGYRPVRVGAQVAAGQGLAVEVPDTRTCALDLLEAGPSGFAHVRARTSAGLVVRRTVLVPVDSWTALAEAAQRRCGYVVPEAALTTTVRASRSGGRWSLQVAVHNGGRSPLQLFDEVLSGAGVSGTPSPALPLSLPPGSTRALSVRLTVDDCAVARASYLQGGASQQAPQLLLQVAPVLAGGTRRGVPTGVVATGPDVVTQLPAYVLHQCGPLRAGDQVAG